MDGDGTGRNARGDRGKTRLELGDLLRGELADAMSLFLVRLGGEADDVLRRARPVQHLAAPFAPRPQDVGVRPAVSRVRVRNARRRTPRTTRTKCFSSSSARRRPPRRGSRAVESRAGVRTPRECFRPNALNGPSLAHGHVLAVVQHGTHFPCFELLCDIGYEIYCDCLPMRRTKRTSPDNRIGECAQCGSLIGPGIGVTPPLVSGGTVRNASFLAGVAARRAPVRGRAEASSRFPHRTSVAEGLRSVRGGSGRRLSSVKLCAVSVSRQGPPTSHQTDGDSARRASRREREGAGVTTDCLTAPGISSR